MKLQEFTEKFRIRLNQQQLEAVQAVSGPMLLLAVPGSGKTTVLITRLGYMVYCAKIIPENILALTYTVAAARDMEVRFKACFGDNLGERLQFRTINGICSNIIQYYGRMIGKTPFSLITDEKYGIRLLSDIYWTTQKEYATESELRNIRTTITYIKNMMLTEAEIERLDEKTGVGISEIYPIYCNELRSHSLMDYDDQMIYAHRILKNSPEVLTYYQNHYPFICVDEAQDTSRIQHAIIELLARSTKNLFMVGDEDQSIYGFRAAYPEALLSFEQNYPGAKILFMEENYRSNAKIVTAADRFIGKNVLRHEKHMKAVQEGGPDIREIMLKSRRTQYEYLKKVGAESGGETAVLYRDNESVLPLVDQLERAGIPYKIRNGDMAFFTHRVVLDIQTIILFALNPKDTDLFQQVYYKLSTYVKKQNVPHICEMSRKKNINVLKAAIRYGNLHESSEHSCMELMSHLNSLLSDNGVEALNRIVGPMGYGKYVERMGIKGSKLYVLKALAWNESSPKRLVERLGELQTIIKEKPMEEDTNLILSTIHASKGLEYDTVYLLDVADGIFPERIPKDCKSMNPQEQQEYEEERRLFYVGVTRAKHRLSIFRWDKKSTFCRELLGDGDRENKSPVWKGSGRSLAYDSIKQQVYGAEFEEFRKSLRKGMTVEHKKYGSGVIMEVDENNTVILFQNRQRKFGLQVLYKNRLLKF